MRLSYPPAEPVTVQYTTIPGTAEDGADYQSVSGTLEFDPGVQTAVVTVPVTTVLFDRSPRTSLGNGDIAVSAPLPGRRAIPIARAETRTA